MQKIDLFVCLFLSLLYILPVNICNIIAASFGCEVCNAICGYVAFTVYLHCSIPNSEVSEEEGSKCLTGFLYYGVRLCSTVISKQRQRGRANR